MGIVTVVVTTVAVDIGCIISIIVIITFGTTALSCISQMRWYIFTRTCVILLCEYEIRKLEK